MVVNLALSKDGNLVYLADAGGGIRVCSVAASSNFINCTAPGTGEPFSYGLALHPTAKILYSSLNNCLPTGPELLKPVGIFLNSKANLLYIIDSGDSGERNITLCNVDSKGSLSKCIPTLQAGIPLSAPASIVIH